MQGEYKKGGQEAPTVVYECACDADLHIWHCNFALPGACNDINVLDISPLLDRIGGGKTMANYRIESTDYHQPYILVSAFAFNR